MWRQSCRQQAQIAQAVGLTPARLFMALAYAEAHDYQHPKCECHGEASGCWRMQPHGTLDIVSAISVSCNSYFRSIAQNVASAELVPVRQDFHPESPGENIAATGLIGLGEQWRSPRFTWRTRIWN
jgi:cell division protein FtsI/penicillin-binding protein 2